jgi:hypothetical protein
MRSTIVIGSLVLAILVGAVAVRHVFVAPDDPQPGPLPPRGAPAVEHSDASRGSPGAPAVVPDAGARARAPSDELLPGDADDLASRWANVDLDAVRAAMPDNLYWKMSAPTSDAVVLEAREAERARWNVEFGKVLSGTGTEEEIQAYYAQRQRLSSDYIEFALYLLEHYLDVLPERDLGLLDLAVRLHQARLEEIPRRLAEALERKQRQDRLREAWLEDQAAFERPSGVD